MGTVLGVSGSNYAGGLVGINGGTVQNSYASVDVSSYAYAGGLVGENQGTISTSYATGLVISVPIFGGCCGAVVYGNSFGGLVGYNNNGTIQSSYATGNVNGGGTGTGGLVGWNAGTLQGSYANGSVTMTANIPSLFCLAFSCVTIGGAIGGLVGLNGGSVSTSYATGNVLGSGGWGSGGSATGGLIGNNLGTIQSSFSIGSVNYGISLANVGGFVAQNSGTITTSFWNTQTSGQATSAGGTGLTTAQMLDLSSFQTTYAGFDFQNVWSPPNQTGQGGQVSANYPQLYALTPVVWDVAPTATKTYGSTNPALAPSNSYGGPSFFLFGGSADSLTSATVFTTSATRAMVESW